MADIFTMNANGITDIMMQATKISYGILSSRMDIKRLQATHPSTTATRARAIRNHGFMSSSLVLLTLQMAVFLYGLPPAGRICLRFTGKLTYYQLV
ncbi:hypothetical protein EUGRSUZ_L01574 [Eucalyptus grandis]|uniref:Uncharacterized protein n=1 Tax=Eucalyptus grandis TaxID=71139 RepID=A0A058ZSR8_EUCGR|nr:hypothetical protein EUGRSUZ_L01574 [Eucalyptus grandis]